MTDGLDAKRVRTLLAELATDLDAQGLDVTLWIVGGAALLLQDIIERATLDVDASYRHSVQVQEAIQRVAQRHHLASDWLNNRSAAFLPDQQEWLPWFTIGTVNIELASPRMLLAMKIASARSKDVDDILALADCLGITDPEEAARIAYEMYGEASPALPDPWPDRALFMRAVMVASLDGARLTDDYEHSRSSIAAQIKAARKHSGLSQTELADVAGLSRPTVARIEAGQDVSWSSVTRVADALGLKARLL